MNTVVPDGDLTVWWGLMAPHTDYLCNNRHYGMETGDTFRRAASYDARADEVIE